MEKITKDSIKVIISNDDIKIQSKKGVDEYFYLSLLPFAKIEQAMGISTQFKIMCALSKKCQRKITFKGLSKAKRWFHDNEKKFIDELLKYYDEVSRISDDANKLSENGFTGRFFDSPELKRLTEGKYTLYALESPTTVLKRFIRLSDKLNSAIRLLNYYISADKETDGGKTFVNIMYTTTFYLF